MSQTVDLLIEARWVLPIVPANTVLDGHAIAVTDGRIVAVGPAEEMNARFEPRERSIRATHAVLPGFVNAHTQAAMTLLRGLPVRGPRAKWLRETLRSVESRVIGPDFVRDGTQLAVAEMLRSGITSFADASALPEEAARVAASVRIRAAIGLPVADEPNAWAEDATAHFAKAERLWDEYKANPWVSLYFAPREAAEVRDETLLRLRRVADELDARVAMSVSAGGLASRDQQGTPLWVLEDLGLLRPGFVAIHPADLRDADLEVVARTGISIVACTQSDLRLGSGRSPLQRLVAQQVPVGLGTGDPVSAGALDMFAEARATALANNGMGGYAERISSHEVLRMATSGGATAMGIGALAGSIEAGKAADLICVDLGELPCQQPAARVSSAGTAESVADAILYAATRKQVSDVWASGRALVAGGKLLVLDEERLLATAARWAQRLGDLS